MLVCPRAPGLVGDDGAGDAPHDHDSMALPPVGQERGSLPHGVARCFGGCFIQPDPLLREQPAILTTHRHLRITLRRTEFVPAPHLCVAPRVIGGALGGSCFSDDAAPGGAHRGVVNVRVTAGWVWVEQ